MKLLVIWLLGVPLAVAAMCTAAALWPRGAAADPAAANRSASTFAVPRRHGQSDLQDVLPSIGP